MNEISLEKWIGLENVLSWDFSSHSELVVNVSRDARFKLLAEGTFIAALQTLRCACHVLQVRLGFPIRRPMDGPSDFAIPDILNCLGGAALIQSADQITDSEGYDVTEAFTEMLWNAHMIRGQGAVGDGKKQSIISRFPGASVPRCLRHDSEVAIPSRLQFEELLRRLGKGLGATGFKSTDSFLDSITEDELSGFLFEAFRNVIEHNTEKIQPGVWGIVVDKLVLPAGENFRNREQVPAFLHDYLSKAIGSEPTKKGAFLLAVTVSDYGHGIQHTLPSKPEEKSWERLVRAFTRGVSRKPKSGSPDWGQGLPNILQTIGHLKALFFIRSAEEAALADGTTGRPELARVTGEGKTNSAVRGTALTVVWIVGDDNPDQATFDF
jgi:hypothetical protein